MTLRPGDTLDFIITASDPLGGSLLFFATVGYSDFRWQDANSFSITFSEADIGLSSRVYTYVKSGRDYHAVGEFDDYIRFFYTVLPRIS